MNKKPFLLEANLYSKMLEMNEKGSVIHKWQTRRLLSVALILIIGTVLSILSPANVSIILGFTIASAVLIFFNSRKSIENLYSNYRFQRQLEFSKFCRLIIPYLSTSDNQVSMYGVFDKIVNRMRYDDDKKNLKILMKQMSDEPENITPFIEFGRKMSDTDFSAIFMTTIFDIKDGCNDPQIITRLGELASKEILEKIQDIKNKKLSRFTFFTTKIAFSCFLIIFGFGIAYLFATFSQMFDIMNG